MKSFRNRLAVVLSALILILGTGCPQPVEPETDYSADVATAKSSLAIEFASGDSATSITQDITLPAKVGDVSVKWSSSNIAVISNDGDVVRPAFADGNANVTLTATLSKGTASDTKAFNVTVLALAPYSYTVTFDSQNADTAANPNSITVTEPATTVASLPTAPVKDGFEFGGWFTQANGEGTAFTTSTVVNGNITVYAKWTATAPVDTSAQDVASLKSTLAISFADGDTATSVTKNIILPSGSNGVSVSWSSTNTSVVSTAGVVTRPAFADGNASVTLTATLSKGTASDTKAFALTVIAVAPYSYVVTFDSQNADTAASPASITVTEPATTISSLPSAPEKSGFTFGGWFTQTEGNGTEFTANTTVSGSITVYAKWTAVATPTEKNIYALDSNGNLKKRSLSPDSSWNYVDSSSSYNLSGPKAINIVGNEIYALDGNGNLKKRSLSPDSSWNYVDSSSTYNLSLPLAINIVENEIYALDGNGNLKKRSLSPDSSWNYVDSSSTYNLSSPLAINIVN